MTGLALVVLTVIGCGLIVIALTTPGWLSFETNDNVSPQKYKIDQDPKRVLV